VEIGVLPDPLELPEDMSSEELADYLVSVTRSCSIEVEWDFAIPVTAP